jgi:hypothetical protein
MSKQQVANTPYQDKLEALAVAVGSGTPVILWGPPGQGKTSAIEAIAKATERKMETVIASIREPSDFAGLPNIVTAPNGTQRAVLIPPDWAESLASDPKHNGILFLDEISTAAPSTQAALLRVVVSRTVGSLYLGDDIAIVAAANPPEQAADGWDLAAPMANRFIHLTDWELPANVVVEGFTNEWPTVPIKPVDPIRLKREDAKARLLVGGFLRKLPEKVTIIPKENSEAGRAFPTPRSWEMAAKLYGYAKASDVSAVAITILMRGCVGEGAGIEFLNWVDELDLPDPEKLLKDPESFKVPDRGDKVFQVAYSVIAAYNAEPTEPRFHALGRIIAVIVNSDHADVGATVATIWMQKCRSLLTPNPKPESATIKTLTPILKQAGLLKS